MREKEKSKSTSTKSVVHSDFPVIFSSFLIRFYRENNIKGKGKGTRKGYVCLQREREAREKEKEGEN